MTGTASTIAGPVAGTGATFTKHGTGTLTLTGSNSYTGLTTVTAGVLQLNGPAGGNDTVVGNVTVGPAGTLRLMATEVVADTSSFTVDGVFDQAGFNEAIGNLTGDGLVFVHAGGTVVERELAARERLDVDTGCVVAFTGDIGFDVRAVGGIKSMLFGGEGVFLATLTGPGKVWLQSLPFSRLAGRMLASAPQRGGHRDEGSVLGGLGNILGGDRDF